MSWDRYFSRVRTWLPEPRVLHPYPDARFRATHSRQEPYAGNLQVRICAGGDGLTVVPTATLLEAKMRGPQSRALLSPTCDGPSGRAGVAAIQVIHCAQMRSARDRTSVATHQRWRSYPQSSAHRRGDGEASRSEPAADRAHRKKGCAEKGDPGMVSGCALSVALRASSTALESVLPCFGITNPARNDVTIYTPHTLVFQ
jgi:hypothetical protein